MQREKVTSHKPLKVATAKKSFPSVYMINTTCFDECFLFHVLTGRHYFLYKFIVTQRFGQKQHPKGVLRKRCSENMQEIYMRAPMPKCDFNKVTSLGGSSGVTTILLCSLKQVFWKRSAFCIRYLYTNIYYYQWFPAKFLLLKFVVFLLFPFVNVLHTVKFRN